MIIPIIINSHEEIPVGNCQHSVKISRGDWACLSKEQYNTMQLQKEKKHEEEVKHFKDLGFHYITLAILVIATIIAIVK